MKSWLKLANSMFEFVRSAIPLSPEAFESNEMWDCTATSRGSHDHETLKFRQQAINFKDKTSMQSLNNDGGRPVREKFSKHYNKVGEHLEQVERPAGYEPSADSLRRHTARVRSEVDIIILLWDIVDLRSLWRSKSLVFRHRTDVDVPCVQLVTSSCTGIDDQVRRPSL